MKPNKKQAKKESSSDIDRIGQIDRIAKIDNEIDTLALSKQQGSNFGELAAMGLLGFISIAVILFAYPEDICGIEGLTVKMFAMLLPTIVVFLFANIMDLWADRDFPIMREHENTPENKRTLSWKFGIAFRDTKSQKFEQRLSFIMCILIVSIYGYFLWQEWVVVGGEFACKM